MIKSKPKYKDKCKLQGDKLVVDGVKYTVHTLGTLPIELAAYQAAEKRDNSVTANQILKSQTLIDAKRL